MTRWLSTHVHVIPGTNSFPRNVQAMGTRDDGTDWFVTERVYNGKVDRAKARALDALDDFLDASPTEAKQ